MSSNLFQYLLCIDYRLNFRCKTAFGPNQFHCQYVFPDKRFILARLVKIYHFGKI